MITNIMTMQNVQAQGTNYYVGGTGASDGNPGTSLLPFRTIQKAARIAVAGDIIKIRTGTYRETITPTNSGTSYQPDGTAVVIISGTNTADGGWTVHSGNIYKRIITLPVADGFNAFTNSSNTILFTNQVFKDGVMQILARWPKANSVQDLFDKTKMRARGDMVSFGVNSLTDNSIPPDLTGGYVSMNGWYQTQTRQITSQEGSTINYYTTLASSEKFLKFYYVTGKLSLLTQAGEWHYESGILYFWQTGGGSPTGVEYKARNWGFDLRGKSNTTIYGLQFLGCDPVNGDSGSTNTTIDGIVANYINHDFNQFDAGAGNIRSAKQSGIKLLGANSVIKNSEIAYAGAHGIWLGPNCRAENNLIHDIAYNGAWGAPLRPWDADDGQVMTRNTIYRTGRGAIELHANGKATLNMDISYNDISMFNMLSVDGGAIYSGWLTDLTGTRIHHNWFHDTGVTKLGGVEGVQVTGVYIDQASGPVTIDHNVHWNGDECDYYAQSAVEERDNGGCKLYNNTFVNTDRPYINYSTPAKSDVQRNNIYRGDIVCNNPDIASSLLKGVYPKFLNTGHGGLKARLKPDSPAIDTGIEIPGVTDGYVGNAPDKGAYEYGGTDWVPGYVAPGAKQTPTSKPQLDHHYKGSELILPGVDKTNPFIYDNDIFNDMVDIYFEIAMSKLNGGTMKGIVVTYDINEPHIPFQSQMDDANSAVRRCRDSNMGTIPDPVFGSSGKLTRPASGNIEETPFTISDGSTLIVNAANTYGTVDKPLVVFLGGQPSTVAVAYLQDPTIADKVIVCHIDPLGYNGADSWATYICAKKMRYFAWGDKLWWWSGTYEKQVIIDNPPILQDSGFDALPDNPVCNYLKTTYKNKWPNKVYHDLGDGALAIYFQDKTQFSDVQKRNASYNNGCVFTDTNDSQFDVLSVSAMTADNMRKQGFTFFEVMGNPQVYAK